MKKTIFLNLRTLESVCIGFSQQVKRWSHDHTRWTEAVMFNKNLKEAEGGIKIDVINPSNIDAMADTLKERGSRYGHFADHANTTQRIKEAYHRSPNWDRLPRFAKEALEMEAHKVGRILEGDWKYLDSWLDREGYARLAKECMEEYTREVEATSIDFHAHNKRYGRD